MFSLSLILLYSIYIQQGYKMRNIVCIACMCVYVCVCVCVCMYVRMYVRMHACMLCMYMCVCVCVCVCHTHRMSYTVRYSASAANPRLRLE
jgi:hypothetical protein